MTPKGTGSLIVNSGNVGIGTTSPNAKLDIGQDNIITLDDTGSATGFIGLGSYNNGTTNVAQGFSYYGFGLEIDRPNQNISFNSYDSSGSTSSGTNILVLKREGNVGIGNTTPQAKLDVAGGIRMADDTDAASADKVGTQRYRTGTEYVEVSGVELIVNGDFANGSDWTLGNGWTVSGGTASKTGTDLSYLTQFSLTSVIGKTYNVKVSATNVTTGNWRIENFTPSTSYTTDKEVDITFTATTTGNFRILGWNGFNGSIDNVSVMEVVQQNASYVDMCMQTGASTYEWVNITQNNW
jgi:hypothetical protein